MSGSTPGAWKAIRPKNDPNAWDVVNEKSGTVIVRLPWGTYEQIVHLIAAAPDLLYAAKLAALNFSRQNLHPDVNFLGDDDHEAWTALNAAIAKAKGPAEEK